MDLKARHSKISKKQLRIAHDVPFYQIKVRKELIRLVTVENMTVKTAHSLLGINYSTAKMIIRKFRRSGKITQFRRQKKQEFTENVSVDHILRQQENGDNNQQSGKYYQNSGQQITDFQFPVFFFPNQAYCQEISLMNTGIQLQSVPLINWWSSAKNYFPL